jgi:Cys-rich protein (TIGR01571 family)
MPAYPSGSMTATSSEFQWGAWEEAAGSYAVCQRPYNSAQAFFWIVTWAFFAYAGWRRIQMRRRFGLPGDDVRDYTTWLLCPACALCQETRTLAHNRVDGGVWHGPAQVLPTTMARPPMQHFPTATPFAQQQAGQFGAYPQQQQQAQAPVWGAGPQAGQYASTAALFPPAAAAHAAPMPPPPPVPPPAAVAPLPPPVPPPAAALQQQSTGGYVPPSSDLV